MRRPLVPLATILLLALLAGNALGADFLAGWQALEAQDFPRAARLLGEAARAGDGRAAAVLADMYDRGWGVSRDSGQAAYWRQVAAERGDRESAYWLGERHARGDGMRRDDAEARRWFRAAAEAGHAPAQLALSKLLSVAGSTDKDIAEADFWYRRALAGGATDRSVLPPPMPATEAPQRTLSEWRAEKFQGRGPGRAPRTAWMQPHWSGPVLVVPGGAPYWITVPVVPLPPLSPPVR